MNALLALPDRIAASYRDLLLLAGRLCIGVLFIPDAYGKILNFQRFADSLGPKGLPFPTVWAVLAIVAAGAGGLGVLLGYRTRLAALLLIAFVIMANLTSHPFWEFQEAARRAQEASFWKNISLIGGLIFLFVQGSGRLAADRGRTAGG